MRWMLLGLVSLGLLQALAAEGIGWRKWKSKTGSEIEARVVKIHPHPRINESSMEFETNDGRKFRVTYKDLSLDDQVWLLQNHRAALEGTGGEGADSGAGEEEGGEVETKVVEGDKLDGEQLFPIPDGLKVVRGSLPSLGEEDSESDERGVQAVTNHLFWWAKMGLADFEVGEDEERSWERIEKAVRRRWKGDGWKGEDVMAVMDVMLHREGKGVKAATVQNLECARIEEMALAASDLSFVVLTFKAYSGDRYQWSIAMSLLDCTGDGKATVAIDGARITGKLTVEKSEHRDAERKEYQDLVFAIDPADRSEFAKECRDDELVLKLMAGDKPVRVLSVDFELPKEEEKEEDE